LRQATTDRWSAARTPGRWRPLISDSPTASGNFGQRLAAAMTMILSPLFNPTPTTM
jgi:hypothetical protein